MAENSTKDAAQAQFARLQRSNGKQAVADYEAEAVALREKTARLRALRLARDAELAAAGKPVPGAKKTKAAAKPKGAKPAKGTLADWIKAREDGGHSN
jgi:hypothetical protein